MSEKNRSAYQKIEDGVVGGYRKVENGAVSGFRKVCDFFIKKLFSARARPWRRPGIV